MIEIDIRAVDDLSRPESKQVFELISAEWPDDPSLVEDLDSYVRRPKKRTVPVIAEKDLRRYLIWEGDTLLAHAKTFARNIQLPSGEVHEVLALACVVVRGDQRGQGLGVQIVQNALQPVDAGKYSVALFQTVVPEFYERLGAKRIFNTFLSSDDNQPSLWNEVVMIYPSTHPWYTGQLILEGAGY